LIPGMPKGLTSAISQIMPSEVEVDLRSERLGLSGRLDRLISEGHVPSLIGTGFGPKS
jgi:hypothetical protein